MTSEHAEPFRGIDPGCTTADRDYADRVLHAAWLRGVADILFDLENVFPMIHFGSAGLGLIAANLLDHADCTERHSTAKIVVHDAPPDDGGRP